MKKRIRTQGILMFSSLALVILLSRFFFPSWKEKSYDEILDAAGIGMILLGFLFRISARGYKAEQSADGKRFVAGGPYRLLRHPMYFGTLLIGLGVIAVLLNQWAVLIFLVVFLLLYVPQTRKEERALRRQFGDVYASYCSKTPGYFPNLSLFLRSNSAPCLPLKSAWIRKEWTSVIGTCLFIMGIEIWEDVRLFGRAEYKEETLKLALYFLCALFLMGVCCQTGSGVRGEGTPKARQRGG